MLAGSLVVTLLILGVGLPALMVLLWAIRNGQFDDPDLAAWQILDDEDLRARRPWEGPAQIAERVRLYGATDVAGVRSHGADTWHKWL